VRESSLLVESICQRTSIAPTRALVRCDRRGDASRVEQLDRRREPIPAPRFGVHRKSARAQLLDLLPDRRARDAERIRDPGARHFATAREQREQLRRRGGPACAERDRRWRGPKRRSAHRLSVAASTTLSCAARSGRARRCPHVSGAVRWTLVPRRTIGSFRGGTRGTIACFQWEK
jgi:hypothetical protein